jgi:hypothetical protein
MVARLRRPVAGPDITMNKLQQIHLLNDLAPAAREGGDGKTSLTELKQLWLMGR